MAGRIVCFGELLLRFTAPGHERLMQTARFDVHHGGAEANVAVSLARFGHSTVVVSALPENPFGYSHREALRMQGVDINAIQMTEGRIGTYFLETGAVRRPSRIIYDRAGSVFALTNAGTYDWPQLLEHADWLHLSGITPAVGPEPAKAALVSVEAAKAAGVKVSFDGNYREALWKAWGGDGPAILRQLLSLTDLAFINERDVALLLDTLPESRGDALARAFERFEGLGTIACTRREQASVSDQTLTGEIYTREKKWVSRAHSLVGVVDRIGGGDAFAAGILHGLIDGRDPQWTVDFATAASAIKHSIPGDWNLTNLAEVEEAMSEAGLDVRR